MKNYVFVFNKTNMMDVVIMQNIQKYLDLNDCCLPVSKTWVKAYQSSNEFALLKGKNKKKLFKKACILGNLKLVKYLYQKGVGDKNQGIYYAAQGGHKDLVLYWIDQGASNWNDGLCGAAKGGHKDLVEFFIEKSATDGVPRTTGLGTYRDGSDGGRVPPPDWNLAMEVAAKRGHKDLVELFIEKGANYWDWGLEAAARGGYKDLILFFIGRGADSWNWGMNGAARGGHKDLVLFFIERGANDWNYAMLGAAMGGHKDLVEFFKSKMV